VAYNPATAFRVSAPSTVVAGQPFAVTVTAIDAWGNTASTYAGTVHFASSDLDAELPDDYTFGAEDSGTHTFTATLHTSGFQFVSIRDTVNTSLAAALSLLVEDGSDALPSEWVGPWKHENSYFSRV
jgi:hypothetical protein